MKKVLAGLVGVVAGVVYGVQTHKPAVADWESVGRVWHVRADGSDETGDGSAEAPFATVGRGMLAVGPDEILEIGPGTYTISEPVKTDDAKITENMQYAHVTIRGTDAENRPVINGDGKVRGMELHGMGILFENLVVSNCWVSDGDHGAAMKLDNLGWGDGAEMWRLGYKFANCDFTACTNVWSEGTDKDAPGAITARKTIFERCNFIDNYSGRAGGAVRCSVVGSSTTWQQFFGCTFRGNTALCQGGAVIGAGNHHGKNFFYGCTFESNSLRQTTGEVHGGAIYGGIGTVSNCTFRWNYCAGGGAAIFARANIWDTGLITDTVFASNRLGTTAENYHGGAAVTSWHAATVSNCTFIANAVEGDRGDGNGGAVKLMLGGKVLDCTFTNNSARIGGAVHASMNKDGWKMEFARNKFLGNKSLFEGGGSTTGGGACYIYLGDCGENPGELEFRDSLVAGNEALKDGGGVWLQTTGTPKGRWEVTFAGNAFSNNVAGLDGGALGMSSGTAGRMLFDRNHFCGNSAVAAGGAWHVSGASNMTVEVRNSLFAGNSAGTEAGAVYAKNFAMIENGGEGQGHMLVRAENCTFAANAATKAGGAGGAVKVGRLTDLAATNCFYALNMSGVEGAEDVAVEATGAYVEGWSVHSGARDPRFMDAAAGDWRITPRSPARNAGVVLGWMGDGAGGWVKDLGGVVPRVQGAAPDAGCYELLFVPGMVMVVR